MFFGFIIIAIQAEEMIGKHPQSLGGEMWIQASVVCFFIWTVFLTIKLESPTFINWGWVFFPFWTCLSFLFLVTEGFPSHNHNFHTPYSTQAPYISVIPINALTVLLLFTILEVLHLEKFLLDNHWTIRFIPFWYFVCIVVLLVVTYIRHSPSRLKAAAWSIAIFVPIVAFLVLLYFYLVGSIQSLTVVFIPVYFILVLLWLLSCVIPMAT
jgi:hypothetical protein